MTEAAVAKLFEYGIVGIVALGAIWGNVHQWREARKRERDYSEKVEAMQKAFAEEQAELRDVTAAENSALRERLVSKAETWMAKYYELAEGLKAVLVAKRGRDGDA